MGFTRKLPAWIIICVTGIGVAIICRGTRSTTVLNLLGEDSWIITPPVCTELNRLERPNQLLVTLADYDTAEEAAQEYWAWCGLTDSERLLKQASIEPAPLKLGPNFKRQFTTLTVGIDCIGLGWYSSDNLYQTDQIPFTPGP